MGAVVPRGDQIRRVGVVFAGGPAPSANAVISAAVSSFLEDGREVIGFFHGYSNLQHYHPVTSRLLPDKHYRILTLGDVRGIRNERGILIGTARANPGRAVSGPADLDDPDKTRLLWNVYNALVDLGIDALISIGGDGTLNTANLLVELQRRMPPAARRVRIVHLPKTIDNDYHGIDFTFGFFTAVDFIAKEVQNLIADAMATSSWFIVETMGRKAGWLSYGVAIAGEAHLVIAREDVDDTLLTPGPGPRFLDPARLAGRIVEVMLTRERRHDQHHGVVVLAEGLAELLPPTLTGQGTQDAYGALSLGSVALARLVAATVADHYHAATGRKKKVNGVQLGYESRCAPPHAFDVMLGSQLGVGAFRALVEEGLDGHLVSVSGQLELRYVPFADVIDPESLRAQVRFLPPGSDFHRLARFLEARAEPARDWTPGPRQES
jgi:6-phosphofructokinase 1